MSGRVPSKDFHAHSVVMLAATGVLITALSTACRSAPQVFVRDAVAPEYPRIAEMALIQGGVNVTVEIGEDGRVLTATGSGPPILVRAAEANARSWVFGFSRRPRRFPVRWRLFYTYKLRETAVDYPVCPTVVFHPPHHVDIETTPPHVEPESPTKEP